jgi:hypothetical protein
MSELSTAPPNAERDVRPERSWPAKSAGVSPARPRGFTFRKSLLRCQPNHWRRRIGHGRDPPEQCGRADVDRRELLLYRNRAADDWGDQPAHSESARATLPDADPETLEGGWARRFVA